MTYPPKSTIFTFVWMSPDEDTLLMSSLPSSSNHSRIPITAVFMSEMQCKEREEEVRRSRDRTWRSLTKSIERETQVMFMLRLLHYPSFCPPTKQLKERDRLLAKDIQTCTLLHGRDRLFCSGKSSIEIHTAWKILRDFSFLQKQSLVLKPLLILHHLLHHQESASTSSFFVSHSIDVRITVNSSDLGVSGDSFMFNKSVNLMSLRHSL